MRRILPITLFLLGLAALARADSVTIDGLKYDGTVVGIKGGRFVLSIANTERSYDLEKLSAATIDSIPKFTDAEKVRESDPKAAAALYKQIIPTINKPELRLFTQWRAIAPTDADGRWTEAVSLFLEVNQAAPTETIWKSRPTHLPNAGSAMLGESAEKVNAAVKAAKSDDARKNLKLFLLD